MKHRLFATVVTALSVVSALWLLTGCETGDGTASLNVFPANVTLVGSTNTVTMIVGSVPNSTTNTPATQLSGGLRDLSFPLEWRVTNPSLGSILSSSGAIATYVRTAQNGINIVTVKDQYDAEGYVTITQL